MSVRIETGNRRYTTNLHDAAVKVARGDATPVTPADKKAIEAYAKVHTIPNGKSIAEKKKKVEQRRQAVKGLADLHASADAEDASAKKGK